jgi:parallel beta-helix repeat protein
MMEDKRALFIVLMILCSVIVTFPNVEIVKAEPKTIVVPDDYSSIPQAIDNAEDGDTILVRSGTYEGIQNQTLIINKTISLIGEDAENTILNLHPPWVTTTIFPDTVLSGYTHPLVINADGVIISGFTITSDGGKIRVNGNNTQIVGNVFATQLYLQGHNQTFAFNNITASLTCSGYYSYVYKNNAVNCIIGTSSGLYASIFSNTVIGGGIGTGGTSNYAVIYDNIVKDGSYISLGSCRNIVTNNTITNSSMGVVIYWGANNTIIRNVITKCQIGLYKTETHSGNIFYANHVENNSYGAKIAYPAPSAETTLYHNNFIDNVKQVNTDPTETVEGHGSIPDWNRSIIHTGLFDNGSEGNFWSDYNGKDNNSDGIGDTPYIIDENRTDNYPLMIPFNISSVSIQLPEWANIEPLNAVPTPSFPPQQSSGDDVPEFPSIYIRADGSVEGTDKIQRNGDLYTFTSDIVNNSLVVLRDNILIDGQNFTIHGNHPSSSSVGISLSARNNITIRQIVVTNFQTGINLENTSQSKVINCSITTNNWEIGISLTNSTSNIISNNAVYSNVSYYSHSISGIALGNSSNNTISENRVTGSFYKGINLDRSNNNTLSVNSVTKSEYGMDLHLSNNNNLVGNTVSSTVRVISRGVYPDSGTGIWLEVNSTYNQIHKNNIENNGEAMRIWDFSSNNMIYENNLMNNTSQISIITRGEFELRYTPIPNSWDNGTVGNYWSDYLTKYPNATEIDNSGIGDTPYLIDENNIDNHPLMKPVEIPELHDGTGETEPFPTLLVIAVTVTIVTVVAVAVIYRRKLSKSNKRGGNH